MEQYCNGQKGLSPRTHLPSLAGAACRMYVLILNTRWTPRVLQLEVVGRSIPVAGPLKGDLRGTALWPAQSLSEDGTELDF